MSQELKSLFQVAQIEITYRHKACAGEFLFVNTPQSAYRIFKDNWDMGKMQLLEQFKILLLDNSSRCLGLSEISTGGLDSCLADPRMIFTTALLAKSTRLILAHNHPSHMLKPSETDLAMTRRIVEAGRLLDISVVDHLILAPHGFYSFADHGTMPNWKPGQGAVSSAPAP